MNPIVLSYVLQALQAIPQIVAAGKSVVDIVNQTSDALKLMQAENRDPSASEWAAQAAIIQKLRDALRS